MGSRGFIGFGFLGLRASDLGCQVSRAEGCTCLGVLVLYVLASGLD